MEGGILSALNSHGVRSSASFSASSFGGNVRVHRSVSVRVRRRDYHDLDPGRAQRHAIGASRLLLVPLAKELLSQRHKHGRIAGEDQLGLFGT